MLKEGNTDSGNEFRKFPDIALSAWRGARGRNDLDFTGGNMEWKKRHHSVKK